MTAHDDYATTLAVLGAPYIATDAVAIVRRKLAEVMATAPLTRGSYDGNLEQADHAPRPSDRVWFHAFGRQRRGLIVKVNRSKALVAYVVPTSPTDIKTANVRIKSLRTTPADR